MRTGVPQVARACSICRHPRVAEIDAALWKSTAYRQVASNFHASESAIYRHSKHLATPSGGQRAKIIEMAQAPSRLQTMGSAAGHEPMRQNTSADAAVIEELLWTQQCMRAIIEWATTEGQPKIALRAIRESRANLAMIVKLGVFKGGHEPPRVVDPALIIEQIQASLSELPLAERRALLREAPPGLVKLLIDQLGPAPPSR